MAEFRLPRIPGVRPGKVHKASGAAKPRTFRIYRFDPDSNENPRVDSFELDLEGCGPMVLDALILIKSAVDSTLTFRRSCREGICGSCAMNISSINHLGLHDPRWQELSGPIMIYPLPHAGRERPGPRPDRISTPSTLP